MLLFWCISYSRDACGLAMWPHVDGHWVPLRTFLVCEFLTTFVTLTPAVLLYRQDVLLCGQMPRDASGTPCVLTFATPVTLTPAVLFCVSR